MHSNKTTNNNNHNKNFKILKEITNHTSNNIDKIFDSNSFNNFLPLYRNKQLSDMQSNIQDTNKYSDSYVIDEIISRLITFQSANE